MVGYGADAGERCAQITRNAGSAMIAECAARQLVAHGPGSLELVGEAVHHDLENPQKRLLGRARRVRLECLMGRVKRRERPEPDGQ